MRREKNKPDKLQPKLTVSKSLDKLEKTIKAYQPKSNFAMINEQDQRIKRLDAWIQQIAKETGVKLKGQL